MFDFLNGIFGIGSSAVSAGGMSHGGSFQFHRNHLRGDAAASYDAIVSTLRNGNTQFHFRHSPSRDDITDAYHAVLADHPELFFTNGRLSMSLVNGRIVSADAGRMMSDAEWRRNLRICDSAVSEITSSMPSKSSTYDRVIHVYKHIIRETEYGLESEDNQNMCSVFDDHLSCCAGYSRAFQYALTSIGIPATYVSGYVDGRIKTGSHAWNLVWIDGQPCYIDITWGDPVYAGIDSNPRRVSYDYFGLGSADMARTHTPDSSIARYMPSVPDGNLNWYRRNGLYFSRYDEKEVASTVQRYIMTNEIGSRHDNLGEIAIRFSNRAAFDAAGTSLCGGGRIGYMTAPAFTANGFSMANMQHSVNEELLIHHFTFDIVRR